MQKQINDTMLMALQTAKSGGQENQETNSDEHFTKIWQKKPMLNRYRLQSPSRQVGSILIEKLLQSDTHVLLSTICDYMIAIYICISI